MIRWLKILFNRRWWWATLLVLLGMGIMIRLSVWQFDRLEQRRAQNAELAATLEADPLRLHAEPLPAPPAELEDRKVAARGEYDFDAQLLLKVQNWQNRAGVHLITPLRLAGRDTAVLVDRGWIPLAEKENLAQFNQPGTVTVEGYVALSQTLLREAAVTPTGPQQEWYRVDVAAIAEQMPYDLLPFYVLQAPPPEGNTELPLRAAPEIDLSEGPHLSYAIQWILFTLILGGGYLFLVYKNEREEETR
jgi:surfeit locus 1 family protein